MVRILWMIHQRDAVGIISKLRVSSRPRCSNQACSYGRGSTCMSGPGQCLVWFRHVRREGPRPRGPGRPGNRNRRHADAGAGVPPQGGVFDVQIHLRQVTSSRSDFVQSAKPPESKTAWILNRYGTGMNTQFLHDRVCRHRLPFQIILSYSTWQAVLPEESARQSPADS